MTLEIIFTGENTSWFNAAIFLRFPPGIHSVYDQGNILRIGDFKAAFITNQFFHLKPRGSNHKFSL